ncbi:MAG: copper chaperone PCu(A)C [Alphaproteobacteria bacterium]|nr:copper chaperone PCu(A)C [Alphaproteobacteria bacterium]MBU1559763.1 copper chaperone PCu(A)C [Alphaproteobacteria bacterium]MBU2305142.1 copper chaperone PCu(A)C [Alphaproteobacteria bacterium]MBU2367947.1 copper chaperone PCu(A)C [Alphaproteobacteria bacterium]
MHRFFIATAFALIATSVQAHDFNAGSIYVDHPMIEEAPPNAPVLGGYVAIYNNGNAEDRLVGIDSPAAQKVELHRSVVTDGIARMQPMTDGILVPAGSSIWVGADGSHAMFVKPDRRYLLGDEVPAVLVFEKAGRVDVTFKVEERSSAEGPGHEDHTQ